MADEDIREGAPKKKKKAAPPPDDDEDDRPARKRRPADDDDELPRKKKAARRDEDEEDEDNDLGSSPLSAIIPVGGSIFALLSLWLSVFGGVLALAGLVLFPKGLLSLVMPGLWPISFLCGALAFLTHKHKASYGSIAGNIRAIIGILISLVVMAMHGFAVFLYVSK